MTPSEETHTEFEIKRLERANLDTLLRYYDLLHDHRLVAAIEAYACANARAAVAIVREVQARKA